MQTKKKALKSLLFFCFLLFSTSNIFAQKNSGNVNPDPSYIQPYRIGIKAMAFSYWGVTAEYILPFGGNHFGISADVCLKRPKFNYYSDDWYINYTSTTSIYYTQFYLGGNYYLKSTGSEPYFGLGYSNVQLKYVFEENVSYIGPSNYGRGSTVFNTSQIQIRAGIKIGKRFMYFTPEIAYVISNYTLPDKLFVNLNYSDGNQGTNILNTDSSEKSFTSPFQLNFVLGFSF